MKADATLEDYQNREVFLKAYLESQISKMNKEMLIGGFVTFQRDGGYIANVKRKAYKDILFKLNKI